jgi:predicted transcriptional regulator
VTTLSALANYPRSGSQRWRVLQEIAAKPRTRDELAADLSLGDSSIDPRVWELRQGGFVEDSDETRPTRQKSRAAVLRVTAKGLYEVREHRRGPAIDA